MVSFLLPLIWSDAFLNINGINGAASNVVYYLLLFAFYFCNYFVIVFFNSALIACVLIHFDGEHPTLGDGFRAAFSRLPQIFLWALVSATVGLTLKIIQERSEKLGKIVAALLGI